VVAVAIREPPIQRNRAARRHLSPGAVLKALGIALLVGVADGYFGYIIESPGTSLAGHCLLVAVVAASVAAAGWWVSRKRNRWFASVFVGTMAAVGVLVVWWTWAFAMPAAMTWDTQATPRAVASLTGIGTDKSVCSNVETGSVGPLDAPYRQCSINGPPGSTVYYYAMSGSTLAGPYRGLIFSYAPSDTFNDECVRHLVGHWYAFTGDPSGRTGYTCIGGP